MISKINGSGGSHAAALKYSMEKEGAKEITSNNLYSKNAQSRADEMSALSNSNTRLKKPNFHASLSLPEGERASDEQWIKASETYLKEMGFDLEKTQYVVTRHNDSTHDHVHIVANRVQLDGKTVSMNNDRRRSHAATRVAENESGLHAYDQKEPKAQKGRLHDMRQKIDSALNNRPTLSEFKDRLQKDGIQLKLNRSESTGFISGVSYTDDSGRSFKGSSLGKGYSLKGLQNRGLQLETNNTFKPKSQKINTMKSGGLGKVISNPSSLLSNPLSMSNALKLTAKMLNASKKVKTVSRSLGVEL